MLTRLSIFLQNLFHFFKSLFVRQEKIDHTEEIENEVVEKNHAVPENDSYDKPDIKQNDTKNLIMINKFLPENCYTKVNTKKTRICLHHTVSSPLSTEGDIVTFVNQNNIATQYIISGDGKVFLLIPENYWAHHLGTKLANNTQLNQETIGIELDAWGQLTKNGDRYLTAYGSVLDSDIPVETLDQPFRGSLHYQEYSDAQINALYLFLKKLSDEHEIPMEGLNKTLNFELLDNFDNSGLYSHSNFRADKSDVYPAKKLIDMLRKL